MLKLQDPPAEPQRTGHAASLGSKTITVLNSISQPIMEMDSMSELWRAFQERAEERGIRLMPLGQCGLMMLPRKNDVGDNAGTHGASTACRCHVAVQYDFHATITDKTANQCLDEYFLHAWQRAISDPHPKVRILAALRAPSLFAFRGDGIGVTRDALEQMLDDVDESVQKAAQMAIQLLDS